MSAESEHWTDTDVHEKLRLMTFARTGLDFRNQQLNGQVSALAAELAKLRKENNHLDGALWSAYCAMADAHHQWPGRHTQNGQAVLCRMLDALCEVRGTDRENTQDAATMSGWLNRALAKGRPG